MVGMLVAISGIFAAAPGARTGVAPAAVEISFVTHAGEGAAGRKRFTRDGCYEETSGGSTGGSEYAREIQVGCLRPADVAPIFSRLDAIPADALAREAAPTGPRQRSLLAGGSETLVVLIRSDGTRWIAANARAGDDILRAVNELPDGNQWHASPPEPPVGAGAQLLVVAVSSTGKVRRIEGALASDGRWWCHRSVVGTRDDEQPSLAKKVPPVTNAPARLGRILSGAHPKAHDDAPADDRRPADGNETNVEVVWPGQPREPLRPVRVARAAAERFATEMKALSPACAGR
jgi:hypothetical protein